MLTYDAPVPDVGQSPLPGNRGDLRRFALDIVLRNLKPDVDSRLRARALAMLYQPALYSSPEVATAVGRR
jgi:hypothetical protein